MPSKIKFARGEGRPRVKKALRKIGEKKEFSNCDMQGTKTRERKDATTILTFKNFPKCVGGKEKIRKEDQVETRMRMLTERFNRLPEKRGGLKR